MKIPSHASAKKRTRRLKGFKFCTFMVFSDIMALKGLITGTGSSVTRAISCNQMKLQYNVTCCALSQMTQCHRPTVCEEGCRVERSVWMVLYAAVCTPVLTTATYCLPCYSGLGKVCEALKRVWIVLDNTHMFT